jgi:hypothetical protein
MQEVFAELQKKFESEVGRREQMMRFHFQNWGTSELEFMVYVMSVADRDLG